MKKWLLNLLNAVDIEDYNRIKESLRVSENVVRQLRKDNSEIHDKYDCHIQTLILEKKHYRKQLDWMIDSEVERIARSSPNPTIVIDKNEGMPKHIQEKKNYE